MSLRRPLLISAWSNRVVVDALKAAIWPRDVLVMQPSKSADRSFIDAVINPKPWLTADIVLGASVRDNVHPVTIGAIANIVAQRSGRAHHGAPPANNAMSEVLAGWLLEIAGDPARYAIPASQLSYVFTSGGHRARAIARTLAHIEHREIVRVIDIGTAAGMIPWLLQADLPQATQFDLLEPGDAFHVPLERLWKHRGTRSYRLLATAAEQSDFGANADLIMICQCLYRIAAAERRAVLDRAWQALDPGGVLLVNEQLRDDGSPSSTRGDIVRRDELISMMPGQPRLFSRKSDWMRPGDLRKVSAKSLGYSGIVLSVRDG